MGGIKGSVKGGCWRSWWGNKGQCERWVLEVMLGGGGGGGWRQCERWVGRWGKGVGVGCLFERWVDGSGVKFNSQISVALRCANYQ